MASDDSILDVALDLSKLTLSRHLLGGDLLLIPQIMKSMTSKMAAKHHREKSIFARELLSKIIDIIDHLINRKQRKAWLDLDVKSQKEIMTSLLTSLEDAAFILANSIQHEDHYLKAQDNISK